MAPFQFMCEEAVDEQFQFICPVLAQFGVDIPLLPAFKEAMLHSSKGLLTHVLARMLEIISVYLQGNAEALELQARYLAAQDEAQGNQRGWTSYL